MKVTKLGIWVFVMLTSAHHPINAMMAASVAVAKAMSPKNRGESLLAGSERREGEPLTPQASAPNPDAEPGMCITVIGLEGLHIDEDAPASPHPIAVATPIAGAVRVQDGKTPVKDDEEEKIVTPYHGLAKAHAKYEEQKIAALGATYTALDTLDIATIITLFTKQIHYKDFHTAHILACKQTDQPFWYVLKKMLALDLSGDSAESFEVFLAISLSLRYYDNDQIHEFKKILLQFAKSPTSVFSNFSQLSDNAKRFISYGLMLKFFALCPGFSLEQPTKAFKLAYSHYPLHVATDADHPPLVYFLVCSGICDINTQFNNQTALFFIQSALMFTCLQSLGINESLRDNFDYLAKSHWDDELIREIYPPKKKGADGVGSNGDKCCVIC